MREREMDIKEYCQGFSDTHIGIYHRKGRQSWDKNTLRKGDARLSIMGKEKFNQFRHSPEVRILAV